MQRREFITALGCSAATLPAMVRAQQPRQVRRIGFLRVGAPPAAFIDGFRQGMREQHLIEGQHFVLEYGLAQNAAQIADVAAELVRRSVDVIVASGTPSVLPAKDAAGQTPVVFVATIDPVAVGLVASLASPGRNITGMTSISGDVIGKRLQMIREVLPTLTRVALLVRESSPDTALYVRESQTAARKLGIELQIEIERNPADLEAIFVAARSAGAVVLADDAEFTAHRDQIAALALRNKLPTVSGLREMAEAGGLMAYGASFGDLYRRAASHVHKILLGVSPADLPIEQPTKFEFVLNMQTAKALGLTIPPSLLALADVVIE
jgi:putative tryptophan/tyrosine transport system substrate-binding protein